jgi:hypothetical protein
VWEGERDFAYVRALVHVSSFGMQTVCVCVCVCVCVWCMHVFQARAISQVGSAAYWITHRWGNRPNCQLTKVFSFVPVCRYVM